MRVGPREVGGWAGLELGVGAGVGVFWEVLGSRGRRGGVVIYVFVASACRPLRMCFCIHLCRVKACAWRVCCPRFCCCDGVSRYAQCVRMSGLVESPLEVSGGGLPEHVM